MNICISENLSILRYKYGYSLEAVAEIISVSRQTVAKWEAGDSYPDLTNCIKLSSLYKVSIDELVNKPLKDIINSDFVTEENHLCGIVDISQECNITIPQSVMQMFDLHPGNKMLLLAEKRQGIALVKCSQF